MKYEIKYETLKAWTSHSFDTITELKNILTGLGTKVYPQRDGMPEKMLDLCFKHNDKF